ncbi:hypothetical protein L6164_021900 [Bauhinia variegata]|uniref:Uncharacterized protein n=1 Tax=Bauhinia variegata TaxID=167791 RepID=A0ACB9MDC8_BAUVA|nr:hypothetical protein L6164_021900 [Bauhinia variegata]
MKGMDLCCSCPASTAVIYSSMDKRSMIRGRSKTTHPHDRSKSQLPHVPCSSHLPVNPKPYFGKQRKSSADKQHVNLHRRSSAQVDHSSTRYLLSGDPAPSLDWVSQSVPLHPTPKSKVFNKDSPPDLRSSSSARSRNQVVVLRVSLHCKGCEGKVRRHISRMEGVTSFSIDFASKKVTIIGDVTPLGVLASISKVKNAQLWPSQASSSSTSAPSSPWST